MAYYNPYITGLYNPFTTQPKGISNTAQICASFWNEMFTPYGWSWKKAIQGEFVYLLSYFFWKGWTLWSHCWVGRSLTKNWGTTPPIQYTCMANTWYIENQIGQCVALKNLYIQTYSWIPTCKALILQKLYILLMATRNLEDHRLRFVVQIQLFTRLYTSQVVFSLDFWTINSITLLGTITVSPTSPHFESMIGTISLLLRCQLVPWRVYKTFFSHISW